jgi:hypothetical protein
MYNGRDAQAFKDTLRALKAGERVSHTFPAPVIIESVAGGHFWRIRRVSDSA